MDLTKRQRMILDFLLSEGRGASIGRGATLGRIASRLGVSARTVHREIARLAAPLRRDYGLVLAGRSGLGLRLIGTPDRLQACREDLALSVPRDLEDEDRRRMLASLLLDADDVVKMYALTTELGTSAAVVRKDLELLRPWFSLHELALTLKRGLGVRLDGGESLRRQAICSIIMEQFGEAGLLDLLRNGDFEDTCPDEPLLLLLRLYPAEHFREAERVLAGLPKGLLPALAPRDYLGLVVHLGVAAVRRDRGRTLEAAAATRSDAADAADAAEYDVTGVARAAVAGMYRGPDDAAEEAEIGAVERFLRGAKPERPEGAALEASIGSIADVRSLIESCGEFLGRDFGNDRLLRDGLAAHWGPAVYRLRNRLPIRNPILDQIRTRYEELFNAVRSACTEVFPSMAIPDDEIGYLVLHFGSAIERDGSGGERFRAMVVCSAGIGSARMLASRIRAEFPEIDIVASLSWFDVKDVRRETWDLLISTIPLPLEEAEYVLVDPLLSPEGIRAIRDHMASRRSALGTIERAAAPKRDGTLGDLKQMGRQLQAVIGILERLRVFSADRTETDWEELLRGAVDRCADAGLVDDRAVAAMDLEARSYDFGILLPSSRILFLHARSSGVSAASISLHAYGRALPKFGRHWQIAPTRLALMLAPRVLDQETQDILNEISVSLLDAGTVEILQSGDEADLRAHYSRYLDRYFRSIPLQGA